ncbi:hypothetical protein Lal_00039280 [Lupinus albus]|nr:hypothetical protein Lal_00039280 [Lupinus albus]
MVHHPTSWSRLISSHTTIAIERRGCEEREDRRILPSTHVVWQRSHHRTSSGGFVSARAELWPPPETVMRKEEGDNQPCFEPPTLYNEPEPLDYQSPLPLPPRVVASHCRRCQDLKKGRGIFGASRDFNLICSLFMLLTWDGEILGYTGGFSPERESARLSEKGSTGSMNSWAILEDSRLSEG